MAFTDTSTLLVGSAATSYVVHTLLLTSKSKYFRIACAGKFLEATSKTFTFDDIEVVHFSMLVSWLYTGVVHAIFKNGRPAYYHLIHLYVLADRLCFEGLRNAVVDTIADLADSTNSVPTPTDTHLLYTGVRESAPLRILILDLFTSKNTDNLLELHQGEWHADFLLDLVVHIKQPVRQAAQRHRLMWYSQKCHVRPTCENCKELLPPDQDGVTCIDCSMIFCTVCMTSGKALSRWNDSKTTDESSVKRIRRANGRAPIEQTHSASTSNKSAEVGKTPMMWIIERGRCKPWKRPRCPLYHEHDETMKCGDYVGPEMHNSFFQPLQVTRNTINYQRN